MKGISASCVNAASSLSAPALRPLTIAKTSPLSTSFLTFAAVAAASAPVSIVCSSMRAVVDSALVVDVCEVGSEHILHRRAGFGERTVFRQDRGDLDACFRETRITVGFDAFEIRDEVGDVFGRSSR